MTSRIRHRRSTVAGAVAILVMSVAAGPAASAAPSPSPGPTTPAAAPAATPAYQFRVEPHDVSLGLPGSPGKQITAFVFGYAPDPTVTIDVSGLAAVAEVRFTDPRCTANGPRASCRLPSLATFEDEIVLFLTPAAQARAGDQGTIIWDQWPPATLPGPGDDTHQVTRWTSKVSIADGGDLVVTPLDAFPTAKVGDRVTIPVTVTNAGSQRVDGLTVTVRLTHGLRPAGYANCRTQPYDPPFDNSTDTTCSIPGVFRPGTTYDAHLEATVEPFASRWQQVIELVYPGAAADSGSDTAPRPSTAHLPVLSLHERTAANDDIDSRDNIASAPLRVDTGLDLAAVGATLTGDPGDVVTAQLGLHNVGPSEIDPTSGLTFLVRPPAGVAVVSSRCDRHDDGQYRCGVGQWLVAPGERVVIEFTLRITAAPGADGEVRIVYRNGSTRDPVVDDVPANDTAVLRVVSDAEGLPITGTSIRPVALTGLVAFLIGLLAVLVSRPSRRRARP